jgi:hypothetical protein
VLSLKMRMTSPLPLECQQLHVEFFGLGQHVAPSGFDLNVPPVVNHHNSEVDGWDEWP